MKILAIQQSIIAENAACAAQLDEAALQNMVQQLAAAKRVFVVGQGRSGLMMRLFAMRLMHLGVQAYVIGETSTPAAQTGDLLVAASGSGETGVTCLMAEKAVSLGLTLVAMTTNAQSRLAKSAQHVVLIPATMPDRHQADSNSVQLMAGLFEQQLHLLCDGLCVALAQTLNIDPSAMWARHANLE